MIPKLKSLKEKLYGEKTEKVDKKEKKTEKK